MKKARLFVAPHQGWSNEDLNPEATEELLDELMAHPVPFVGGNLAVLTGLHGTPYDFDYHDKILFIEDIAETPYKIDRMMHQLRLSGVLEAVSGVIVGQFADCDEDPDMGCTLQQSIAAVLQEYDYPVLFGFPAGHVTHNLPLTFGVEATLTVTKKAGQLHCD